jgi:hypothetical protein
MSHDPAKAANLREHCKLVGTTKLAGLIGVHPSLLRKKAAGTVGITQRDEVAIKQAIIEIASQPRVTQRFTTPTTSKCRQGAMLPEKLR